MRRVIITGANSFIGKKLCQQLDAQGCQVCAVVRDSWKDDLVFRKMKNTRVIKCDMQHYGNLNKLLSRRFDTGIMLAWNGTRGTDRNDRRKQEENYQYSVDCIHSFLDLGCGAVITAGSQAEYGIDHGRDKVLETDICNPNTEYGKAKLELYNAAKNICYGRARLVEPRFFSLYGPDDFEGSMIISMISNMLRNRPCNLTECIQLWDFLYIDDAIDALIRFIHSDHTEGVYNIGSGISRPLKEYVEVMHKLSGSKSILNYGAVAYPVTGIVHTNPSVQRVMDELRWVPDVSFEQGIKRVIRYQRERIGKR